MEVKRTYNEKVFLTRYIIDFTARCLTEKRVLMKKHHLHDFYHSKIHQYSVSRTIILRSFGSAGLIIFAMMRVDNS